VENDELYGATTALLHAIWRAVDPDFKERYRLEIWRIFEDRTRVAAGQNGTLSRFASQLARAMNAAIGRDERERHQAQTVIESGQDRQLLRLCREETPYLILLVRQRVADQRAQVEEDDLDAEHHA